MKKRLLSIALGAVMVLSLLPAAFAASDIDQHWAKNYISYLHDEGIYNPNGSTGKYEPNRNMTRAEFMRYINRAFHFTERAAITYKDVSSRAWYYETIQIAEKYGYINGTSSENMSPNGALTREQAAVIIGRLLKAGPGDITPEQLTFADNSEISSWSAGYIKAAVDKGFLNGYADGTFRPKRVITRGEISKMLYSYLGTSLSRAGRAYTGADLKTDTENVTISESCSLSDAVIKGDLYITEGVGTDSVTLNNVTVEGSIIVSGGTVNLINTACDHMIVSSMIERLLQTTATGSTHIAETEVRSAASLQERGLSAAEQSGFTAVTVKGGGRISLTLDAEVNQLTADSEATVSMKENASVHQMSVNKPVSVTGSGSVFHADIAAAGTSFASSITVSGYTLAEGISASIDGEAVSEDKKAGVVPTSIDVDLAELSSLGDSVQISLPASAESVSLGGKTLSESSDYSRSASGIRLKASILGSLRTGNHSMTIAMSNGQRAGVTITVTDSSAAAKIPELTFDRNTNSSNYRDLNVRLDSALQVEVSDVVLGASSLEYSYNQSSRQLTLRRDSLAKLRTGVYTVTVDLADGGQQLLRLTVRDSSAR